MCVTQCSDTVTYYKNESNVLYCMDRCETTQEGVYNIITRISDNVYECSSKCNSEDFPFVLDGGICGINCSGGQY